MYENAEKIVLVMEYASGGELYDYIEDKRGLADKEARKFFRQIVSAISYLHKVRFAGIHGKIDTQRNSKILYRLQLPSATNIQLEILRPQTCALSESSQ